MIFNKLLAVLFNDPFPDWELGRSLLGNSTDAPLDFSSHTAPLPRMGHPEEPLTYPTQLRPPHPLQNAATLASPVNVGDFAFPNSGYNFTHLAQTTRNHRPTPYDRPHLNSTDLGNSCVHPILSGVPLKHRQQSMQQQRQEFIHQQRQQLLQNQPLLTNPGGLDYQNSSLDYLQPTPQQPPYHLPTLIDNQHSPIYVHQQTQQTQHEFLIEHHSNLHLQPYPLMTQQPPSPPCSENDDLAAFRDAALDYLPNSTTNSIPFLSGDELLASSPPHPQENTTYSSPPQESDSRQTPSSTPHSSKSRRTQKEQHNTVELNYRIRNTDALNALRTLLNLPRSTNRNIVEIATSVLRDYQSKHPNDFNNSLKHPPRK